MVPVLVVLALGVDAEENSVKSTADNGNKDDFLTPVTFFSWWAETSSPMKEEASSAELAVEVEMELESVLATVALGGATLSMVRSGGEFCCLIRVFAADKAPGGGGGGGGRHEAPVSWRARAMRAASHAGGDRPH